MECKEHFVEFHEYCKTCLYKEQDSIEEPCNECLTLTARSGTKKPLCYEEDQKAKFKCKNG